MPFKIEEATAEDAGAIARILVSDETSDFLRLQLGTVDPAVLNEGMVEKIRGRIEKREQLFIVARDEETNEIVSYAQWIPPKDEPEKTPEESARETEEFRQQLLPGMNERLMLDFREQLDILQKRTLRGRRHYLLGNLGTLAWYQRRGAASALARWPFERADRESVPVYLDTDQDGHAIRMYERLGFKRGDAAVFDLSKYGSQGRHTHVAMVREPHQSS